ncbi:MalY/PatB family protein [Thalassobacillus sp. CUG 92003]|uniref:MalY/PatB family protein n=1 Tax=Thalassobacillus sp. CUG 92003 TaxID=2736641 RepID=UPI0015E6CB9C|nr:PatB family C-S lyase [Thalassobacillus sp. CUG 92003]
MRNFREVTDRTGTRSVKWDMTEQLFKDKEVLPMWVADMDFKAPEPVLNALSERVDHGIFGYTMTDEKIGDVIQHWLAKRHGWNIEKDWLSYSPGVIPSIHMIIQSLTEPEDSIMIQTPVYPPFYSVIKAHDRHLVSNPLSFENGHYAIDFEDFEAKIKQNNVKMFILCNPHNPVGRVWKEHELKQMGDICLRHNVQIVSDEIHADLIFPGHAHVPIAKLSEDLNQATITTLSPTKTFNLAGLQASYLVIANEETRKTIKDQFNQQGLYMLNTLGITALEAAYQDGEEWLEKLIETLDEHKSYVIKRLHQETSHIRVVEPEGTYLLWLDCRSLNLSQNELRRFMREDAKVGLNDGTSFGDEGEGFMRLNIAAPFATLEEGLDRIITAINTTYSSQ